MVNAVSAKILASFQEAVAKGDAVLEWAIQGGALVKCWVSASFNPNVVSNGVAAPDDQERVTKAIDHSLECRHASVRVQVNGGRVVDVVFTAKADLGGNQMREPRRPA